MGVAWLGISASASTLHFLRIYSPVDVWMDAKKIDRYSCTMPFHTSYGGQRAWEGDKVRVSFAFVFVRVHRKSEQGKESTQLFYFPISFFPFPGALPFPESGPLNKSDGWAGGWRWTGFDELVWGHVCVCSSHFWTPFLSSLGTVVPFEERCPSALRSYPLFVGTTVLAHRWAGRSRISHLCVIGSLCRAFLGVDADDSLRH